MGKQQRVAEGLRQREATTLIELLVVVAIIAILYSLHLSATNRARLAAQKAVCNTYQKAWRKMDYMDKITGGSFWMERDFDIYNCYKCHPSVP
jgi:prepilin-type N-terminal cleavage/methylation domain-containing protein